MHYIMDVLGGRVCPAEGDVDCLVKSIGERMEWDVLSVWHQQVREHSMDVNNTALACSKWQLKWAGKILAYTFSDYHFIFNLNIGRKKIDPMSAPS